MISNEEHRIARLAWIRDLSSAFREVNATPAGKEVFQNILIFGNMYGSSSHHDINHTIRLEGRRDVAVFIVNILDPDMEAEELLNYFDGIFGRENTMPPNLMKPKKKEDR